jgi:predicted GNAT family acetyltransferase
MLIQHKETGTKGVLFVQGEDGGLLAELLYMKKQPSTMIIEHTEVSDELRGQNVGYQLVSTAVEFARLHGLKIMPICPIAKAIINKKTEFHDVLMQ